MGEREEAIVEVKRLIGEINMFLDIESFYSIYTACEAVMITIDEADLEN